MAPRRGRAKETNLTQMNGDLAQLYAIVEGADAAPTTQARAGFAELETRLTALLARWSELESRDVPALHRQLQAAGLPAAE